MPTVQVTILGSKKEKEMSKKIEMIIGERFGRLVILEDAGKDKGGNAIWLCQCDCGNTKPVAGYSLRNGKTKSCGCLNREALRKVNTTHKMIKTPEYKAWSGMLQRCNNKNDNAYHNYGGRGITVCPEWLDSFETFYANMGKRSKGLTLERINNNGNYESSNCAWRSRTEQSRNQRLQKNNKTKISGVSWHKQHHKYQVRIMANYKTYHIGYYKTIQQAKKARKQAEIKYWGKR